MKMVDYTITALNESNYPRILEIRESSIGF
jgi:hypothetical protein